MKQVTQNLRTGVLAVQEVPIPALKPGGILVRNRYSVISAGTERIKRELAQTGYLGKAKARPDQFKQVLDTMKKEGPISTYRKVMNKLTAPAALGYSSSGEVIAVAADVTNFEVGDPVSCAGGGYAVHAEVVFVPKNLAVKLPENVGFGHAAFTTLGAIAMQGIRQAEVQLGEAVVVIGLGLVGQLTAQIAKAAGCRVIGIDLDPDKIELAKACAVDLAVLRDIETTERVLAFTDHYGADKVIIAAATSSSDPIELAGAIARDRAIVVIVGAVKANVPRSPYYEKELDVRFSRSYGPGRYDQQYEEKGTDYPIGYVRWTEQRNMAAFVELLAQGRLALDKLITHVFPIEKAPKAYDLICGKTDERFLGVLLEYPQTGQEKLATIIQLKETPVACERAPTTQIRIGFIGAGSYAQSYLLPQLNKQKDVQLIGVATATGTNAQHVGKKHGFDFCTTDAREIIKSNEINTVFIATRHNLHAPLVIDALRAGKNVYVEKPLALNEAELKEIIAVYNSKSTTNPTNPINPMLMVGFNRRFAPFTQKLIRHFKERLGPLSIIYRVNAGFIARDHWTQDAVGGGGRIIGEVCHFIDWIGHVVGAKPITVYANTVTGDDSNSINEDTVTVALQYSDGSIGTVHYIAIGDKGLSKERIEVFGTSRAGVIDDFRRLELYSGGQRTAFERNRLAQDKGQAEMIKRYMDTLKEGKELISLQELVMTTDLTFKVRESLKRRTPLELE
jgi:predicted dehydrogenase